MPNLNQELDFLRRLNEQRDHAAALREDALRMLRGIKNLHPVKDGKKLCEIKADNISAYEKWIASGNEVEASLVAKIQNHKAIGGNIEENRKARTTPELNKRLLIPLQNFFHVPRELGGHKLETQATVPVLMAARIMHALTNRAETVFSMTTMFCYYRIIRELYSAGKPDHTFGAARAGTGARTSAFVTSECIRAIFSFEDSANMTAQFFEHSQKFYERYCQLVKTLENIGDECLSAGGKKEEHPIYKWAERELVRAALDFHLSTYSHTRDLCLFYGKNSNDFKNWLEDKIGTLEEGRGLEKPLNIRTKTGRTKKILSEFEEFEKHEDKERNSDNLLFLIPGEGKERITFEYVGEYFKDLTAKILTAITIAKYKIFFAMEEIYDYREAFENPYERDSRNRRVLKTEFSGKEKDRETTDILELYEHSESAHLTALKIINEAYTQADEGKAAVEKMVKDSRDLSEILKNLTERCEDIARRIRRVIEPTKRYIKTVIDRELAAGSFDAGELVFAATAFGVMNRWKKSERLKRACDKLVESLPESGRLNTKRPLHASQNGYKLVPIGCEMTRSLAQLLHKSDYEFDSQTVSRMLNIFDEKDRKQAGWNFDGSPYPARPCVWVTAISTLALDRIVRMLNNRINNAIVKHFNVINPDSPHTDLTLNKLIYSDYGFSEYFYNKHEKIYPKNFSTPIALQQMRAHIRRTMMPHMYRNSDKIFSAIFYGPPGTGKTTLAEALALTSRVRLINLSPSDLVLQGQELIEGRARDVFEALSMLTRAVIVFDEFEPVLQWRGGRKEEDAEVPQENPQDEDSDSLKREVLSKYEEQQPLPELNEQQVLVINLVNLLFESSRKNDMDTSKWLEKINVELVKMSAELGKGDSKLKFLMNGMLPKLIKLYDAAKKQALVYCLATNFQNDIDEAAKREGRFDLKIPVYNPCPLSRAGIILYFLTDYADKKKVSLDFKKYPEQIKRYIQVIMATVNEPVSDLAKRIFKIKKESDGSYANPSKFFDYVLGLCETPDFSETKLKELNDLINKRLEKKEIEELKWLIDFEKDYPKQLENADKKALPKMLFDYLSYLPKH